MPVDPSEAGVGVGGSGNASSHVVQEASESTAAGNVNFQGSVMNLALSNAVAVQGAFMNNLANTQAAFSGNIVRQDRVSEAVSVRGSEKVMSDSPSELAGENKILYSTPPTGFTGVGHYPAEPATGSK